MRRRNGVGLRWRGVAGRTHRLGFGEERGQALLEFAIVVPLLFLIIFGIVEFSRAWNNKNDVVHLANEAARFAVVNGVPASCATSSGNWKVPTEATDDGLPTVGGGSTHTQISFTSAASAGVPITVTVTIPFTSFVPLISSIPGFPTSLTGKATMMSEQAYTGPSSC